MQIDCHPHLTSQSLKCLLYDCFYSQHQNQDNITINNQYLIKSEGKKQADIYSFDSNYTQYTHIAKIQQFSQLKCLKFYRSNNNLLIIYTIGQSICLQSINKETDLKVKSFVKINLSQNEVFIYFSDIVRMGQYELFIGYTSLNQFYLVIIKKNNSLQILKIKNEQFSIGFLSWFSKSSLVIQCTNIYLHPYRIDQREHFLLLLSVKNNIVSLNLLQIYPQLKDVKMKVVGTCQSLKKIIPNSAKIRQVVIVSKELYPKSLECIISYQLKQGFILILLVSVNFHKENIFDVSVILQDLPFASFSMEYHHAHLLYTFYCNEQEVYKIYKKKIFGCQQKKHSQNRQSQLLLTLKEKPYYVSIDQKLFITTCSQSYSIQSQNIVSSSSSELSELQQQIAQFKNQINYTYKKQVSKHLKKSPICIQQITYLLTQKIRKIIEWIKNEFNEFNSNEEHTYLILTLEITITISIRNLLLIASLEDIVNIASKKQPQFRMKELCLTISNCQISSVISLLNKIAQNEPKIIQQMMGKFQEQKQVKQGCSQAIKTIFSQAYQIIIANIQSNQSYPKQFQETITTIISYDLANPKVYFQILSQQQKLFKKCVFQSQSVSLFIQYFQHLNLNIEEVKQFAKTIYNNRKQNLKRVIGQTLIRYKRSLKSKMLSYQQINLILEGFIEYPDQLVFQIKKHFPPLLLFYYLKTGNRKEGMNYIKQLAKKTSPNCSEILNLAIADIQQERLTFANENEKKLQRILNLEPKEQSQSQNSQRKKKIKRK